MLRHEAADQRGHHAADSAIIATGLKPLRYS